MVRSDIGLYIFGICSASVKIFCVFRHFKVANEVNFATAFQSLLHVLSISCLLAYSVVVLAVC